MEVKQPSAEVAQLLADFRKRGGVIDHVVMQYVVMQAEGPSGTVYDLHKEAAVLTLEAVAEEWAASGWPLALRMHPELAQGRRITATEFLGPYFDQEKRSLIMPDSKSSTGDLDNFITHGYADAFSDPPHSLHGALDELNALFHAMNEALFGGLDVTSDIYQWSVDWCNYFDAGREWWGAFLWTVHDADQNTLVGVAASTTD